MNVIIELIELQWLDMVLYSLQCFYSLGESVARQMAHCSPALGSWMWWQSWEMIASLKQTLRTWKDAESQKERIAFQVENEEKLIIDKGMLLL